MDAQPLQIVIREERPEDVRGVAEVNELAFGQPDEARIVATVREQGSATISLVACLDERVVGHILFSPVTIDGREEPTGLGLAPMAVRPEYQRRGIGTRLVEAGLERCRRLGVGYVVVLGHPEYYPRFGFRPASGAGLRYEQPVPDEVFMVLELRPECLEGISGVLRYMPAFSGDRT